MAFVQIAIHFRVAVRPLQVRYSRFGTVFAVNLEGNGNLFYFTGRFFEDFEFLTHVKIGFYEAKRNKGVVSVPEALDVFELFVLESEVGVDFGIDPARNKLRVGS